MKQCNRWFSSGTSYKTRLRIISFWIQPIGYNDFHHVTHKRWSHNSIWGSWSCSLPSLENKRLLVLFAGYDSLPRVFNTATWVLKLHNISLTAVAICCNLFGSLCQTSHCTFPYFINICLYFSLSTYIYVESSNKQLHTIFISSSWSM